MFSYFLIIRLIIDVNVTIKINIRRLILNFKNIFFVRRKSLDMTGFVDYVCKNSTHLKP